METKEDKTSAATVDIPKCDLEEYVLRKRLPRRLPKRPNDVYISRKTDFRAQLARQRPTASLLYYVTKEIVDCCRSFFSVMK